MDYYAAKTELAEDLEEFLGISEVRAGIDRVIATGDAAAAAFPPGAQPQMTAEEQSKAYEAVDRLKDQASDIASAVEGYLTSRSREADDVPSGTNMVGKPVTAYSDGFYVELKSDLKEALGYSAAVIAMEEMVEQMNEQKGRKKADTGKTAEALEEIESQANKLARALRSYLFNVSAKYSDVTSNSWLYVKAPN